MSELMTDEIQNEFDQAHHIVFLTGAGVSTASGIPDFRSPNGLYTKNKNAEYYLSHRYFESDPEGFYQYAKENLYFPDAKPNVIHEKIAALSQQDRATVITQNIDNLHEKAGTKHVIDFHGNLYHVYCEKCGQTVDWHEYLKNRLHSKDNGPLRPDVVLYDEGIKQQDIVNSIQAMQNADLIVVVGTSMVVYPFAGLMQYRNPKADVVAVNQQLLNFKFPFKMVQGDAVKFFDELNVNAQ